MSLSDSHRASLGRVIRIHWVLVLAILALVLTVEQDVSKDAVNAFEILFVSALCYMSLQFLHSIHRADRFLAPILFLLDGVFSAMAAVTSGGPLSYYLPLFLIGLTGACLICTPRAAALVVTEHFMLFLGAMYISYNQLLAGLIPLPEADDLGLLLQGVSTEIRRRIYFEQTLRWGVFMGMTVLVCAVWVREIWNREEHLRNREKVMEQKRHLIQMGEMTGRIAHGINTPLGLLSGHLEMFLGETRKGTKTHKRLAELDVFLQRAIGTVRQTLDTSRLSLSQIKPTALGSVLAQVGEAVQAKLKPKDGYLILDVEKDLPEVKVYPESFYQALLNVVENAVDSIPEHGTVTVTAEFRYRSVRLSADDKRGEVCVTVRDTGRGIPPGELDRIFEPFYSTKDFGRGTGLGLAIVKRVMEEHKGTVTVESKVGSGTTVTLSLPTEGPVGPLQGPLSGV